MNVLPDAQTLADRFSMAFADAVMSFVQTGEAQGIDYDPDTLDFTVSPLEAGTSPTDVGFWVADRWQDYVGDIGMTSEPTHREYSAPALRKIIIERLERNGLLRKLALGIAADRLNAELASLHDDSRPH